MMIKCPECNHDVSDKAVMCPHCGFAVKDYTLNKQEHENGYVKALTVFGILSIIGGLFLGVLMFDTTEGAVGLAVMVAGIMWGVVWMAFGNVLSLLQKIKDKICD